MPQSVPVPRSLRGLHPLVARTRQVAGDLGPRDDGRVHVGPKEGIFLLVVSVQSLPRVLRLLQAVSHEVERRGWQLVPNDGRGWTNACGVAIAIGKERYPVKILEGTDRAEYSEADRRRWRRENPWGELPRGARKVVSNGRLTLSIERSSDGARSKWIDGPRGLVESKLSSFFETLESRAVRDRERSVERAQLEAERAVRQAQAAAERELTERLLVDCEAWHRVERMRSFISAIRVRLAQSQADEQLISEWCERGEAWADAHDPMTRLFALSNR